MKIKAIIKKINGFQPGLGDEMIQHIDKQRHLAFKAGAKAVFEICYDSLNRPCVSLDDLAYEHGY